MKDFLVGTRESTFGIWVQSQGELGRSDGASQKQTGKASSGVLREDKSEHWNSKGEAREARGEKKLTVLAEPVGAPSRR